MTTQSLSEYKWKNRLIVVFSDSEKLEKQLYEFKNEAKAFQERKLIVIQAAPKTSRILMPEMSGWQDSNLYQEMKLEKKTDFEIILVGLDGEVKLRQQKLLETKKLFDFIDSMPMRQSEIQKHN
ncbi:hypothetical protein GCM10011532_13950 [Christiangramia forsetii]|nr:hypothetical protein GCM10011532_13950 [Christiangramia forsetii]